LRIARTISEGHLSVDSWGELWNKSTLKALLLPGGALLAAAALLLQTRILPLPAAAVDFYYFAVFAAGILLAWRFHSSRVFFGLVTLFLTHRTLLFFSAGRPVHSGPGRIALEAIALLLPINFVMLSWFRELGLTVAAIFPRLGVLFIQSVFVAVICRPSETTAPSFLHPQLIAAQLFHWTRLPQIGWLAFAAALIVLFFRFLLYRKPVESGLLWSLLAAFAALEAGGIGAIATAYIATGALILTGSIIENSYVLAYHDELTSLPGRRAFNDALLRLKDPYTIAAVDIDHFKAFNDNYGHETGDEVLRMVAAKLARVGGGGLAFRVGGEEFSILFPGERMKEALPHLETLRLEIESSSFRVRKLHDRRRAPHPGLDRRKPSRRKSSQLRSVPRSSGDLSVTVSIGVADPSGRNLEIEQVIQAADKALYRAKKAGRNRVESAGSERTRAKRSIA